MPLYKGEGLGDETTGRPSPNVSECGSHEEIAMSATCRKHSSLLNDAIYMKFINASSKQIQTTVEPLYNGNHREPTFCHLQRGVPYSEASGIFLVGVVMRNRAAEHNVAAFSELSFALH